MVTVNGTTGVSKVQDNTITSAKIVDNTIGLTDVNTSNGIGYKAGDGGSVTQLTSKATAVTLNKPCGQIIMNNAALAANTAVTFQVNCSFVGANDTVVISCAGGGSYGAYSWGITGQATGLFLISLRNITAGSLSEGLTFNFAVIKSVGE